MGGPENWTIFMDAICVSFLLIFFVVVVFPLFRASKDLIRDSQRL